MARNQAARAATAWRWRQAWRTVFFAHWRAPPETLRRALPSELDVDLVGGAGWVTAVAFQLTTRLPGLPAVPACSRLFELNLRTYVRHGDDAGIWFLSMHGHRRLAVWLGRRLTPLPYRFAKIRYTGRGRGYSKFECVQSDQVLFDAAFRPIGELGPAQAGSLDEWLLERYCAFVGDGSRLLRMRVRHAPWRVRPAAARVEAALLGLPHGLALGPPELVHFSAGVEAIAERFEFFEACLLQSGQLPEAIEPL